MELKNSGLVLEQPNEKDWVFGGVSGMELGADPDVMPDGDWLKVDTLADAELQFNRNFDSFSCVTFTSIKAVTEYLKEVHGINEDYSERFIAVMSGTIPGVGNSVRTVLETIRKYGLVKESDFPSITEGMTQAQFFDRDAVTAAILAKGQEWLKLWDFNWETVTTEMGYFKLALHKSPLILTGYSWTQDDNGLYYDYGRQANHCFLGVKVVNNAMIVNDSYPADYQYDTDSQKLEFIKRLSPRFHFASAHRISVKKKVYNNESLYNKIINMIKDIWVWFEVTGSPKGLRAYYCPRDSKGVVKGRQELKFDSIPELTITVKALFASMFSVGLFKKTSWPEVSSLSEETFIK